MHRARRRDPATRATRRRGPFALALIACILGCVFAAEPVGVYVPPSSERSSHEAGAAMSAGQDRTVLLIVFSGRCPIRSCRPPDENEDALARTLVPAAVAALQAAGFTVEARTYRAHTDDDRDRGRGFVSASEDLTSTVQDDVPEGQAGPRRVLLGYSHGTQFAHLLAFEHPDVPFAASVLLDSICLGWDVDHAERLVAALAPGRGAWPATGPYRIGCDVLSVPGVHSHLDLGDVAPWNVARSLELRSGGQALGMVRDARRNVRLDGGRDGIDTLTLRSLRHQASDEVDGPAFDAWMTWLIEVLSAY